MLDFIRQPWTWWFSGILISSVMFFLLYFGKSFGFSSNLRTICTLSGAGKKVSFFNFNWKTQAWNLVFLTGTVIGGFIASQFLSNGQAVEISSKTIEVLSGMGFSNPESYQPKELFSAEAILTWKGFGILALGGLLVGFGARYAGGCTSGHAISGLSDLQLPSLIAVIGFFIGGLIMTYFILPLIF